MRRLAQVGLHRALCTAFDGVAVSVAGQQRLSKHVYRLRLAVDGHTRCVIVKRLTPRAAACNELLRRRWLPAVRLEGYAPQLLGVAADERGRGIWHVYEDLGDGVLDSVNPDLDSVRAVVEAVACIHVRFADHPLLADCRLHGADLSVSFYSQSVHDALRALDGLRPPAIDLQPHQIVTRDRLLRHLTALVVEQRVRSRAVVELGGAETLLHGDLWTTNTLVVAARQGWRGCLVDWDRAGVGPVCYDLSTFLLRFPAEYRPAIMDMYRAAVGRLGRRLADDNVLNDLFDTAEQARYACCVIWPALAILQDGAEWGFDALAAVADWFDALRPVLPVRDGPA